MKTTAKPSTETKTSSSTPAKGVDARVDWLEQTLYFDSPSYFASIIEAINAAERDVLVEMYILEPDATGWPLIRALEAAGRRGVDVRVLVDGVGSPHWMSGPFEALAAAGVESRIYHPTPWPVARFLPADTELPTRLLNTLRHINRRDHRKLLVIDQRLAFTGGMNASAAHSQWRDTSVRLRGTGVADLCASFELIWRRGENLTHHHSRHASPAEKRAAVRHPLVESNHSLRLRQRFYRLLIRRILRAERRVWIATPYFVPGARLLGALSRAAQRGIDVRLLTPEISDVPPVRWLSRLNYQTLLSAGVKLYEYQPTMMHAKTLLIDDWARVGSSNLNFRSRYSDLEIDVVLTGPSAPSQLAEQYEYDLQQARRITHIDSPWFERLGGYLAWLFRRML